MSAHRTARIRSLGVAAIVALAVPSAADPNDLASNRPDSRHDSCAFPAVSAPMFNDGGLVAGDATEASASVPIFQSCETPANNSGWPPGADVSYSFDGLDSDQQAAAEWAMGEWQSYAASKGLDITFTDDDADWTLDFGIDTGIGAIAEVGGTADPSTGSRNTGWININDSGNTALKPVAAGQPGRQDYLDALKKVYLHEIGHTFGLGNTGSGCGAPTDSVMNDFCGDNDTGGSGFSSAVSLEITVCDDEAIDEWYEDWEGDSGQESDYEYEPEEWCETVWSVTFVYYNGQLVWITWHFPLYTQCYPIEV